MKYATASKIFTLALALLLASTSALAATKAKVNLPHSTEVNGTTLKPGTYILEWDGSGPNIDVSIVQDKTVVAKVPARLVDRQRASDQTGIEVGTNADGTKVLTGAFFTGKKFALEFNGLVGSAQAGSAK